MSLLHAPLSHPRLRKRLLPLACLATLATAGFAQQPSTAVDAPQAALIVQPQSASVAQPQTALPPVAAISLDDAIAQARANEPAFAAAVAASRNAALDRSIARSALLPSVEYHNQYLYTQPLHAPAGTGVGSPAISSNPRFIANNAVHEYMSQGQVNETIGVQQINAVGRASAALAVATAELEVAQRGLVASVAGLFYAASASGRKVSVAERAASEAASLTTLTQQRETAREVAHADVVKAQLQQQQRDRDLADARLEAERGRLELAVLLFPDPRTPYTLVVPETPPSVPARADVEAALARHNPELASALASKHLADLNVFAARAAYLPNLALNYTYGIDAAQFAAKGTDGSHNLGYSASVTLDIPVWDWFTTRDRVRQSEINRETARMVLTNTQRKLIADLEEFYDEAVAAHDQLDSLNLSVTTAAESLRLTRLSYSAGETPILEIVDAENSLTAAELAREDGNVRYQTALANLQLLTGTI
jgi:outer membrane protein TolC